MQYVQPIQIVNLAELQDLKTILSSNGSNLNSDVAVSGKHFQETSGGKINPKMKSALQKVNRATEELAKIGGADSSVKPGSALHKAIQ